MSVLTFKLCHSTGLNEFKKENIYAFNVQMACVSVEQYIQINIFDQILVVYDRMFPDEGLLPRI